MSYLFSRDEFLVFVQTGTESELLDTYLQAEFIVKANDVGSAVIVMPGQVPLMTASSSNPGDGILRKMTSYVRYNASSPFSPTRSRIRLKRVVPIGPPGYSGWNTGAVTTAGQTMASMFTGELVRVDETWDAENGPTTTLTYECDNRYLRNAVVKPEPSNSAPPYSTIVSDNQPSAFSTTKASTALLHYINFNAGPSATPVGRQQITAAGDLYPTVGSPGIGVGTSVRVLGRWQNLLALCQEIADAGGFCFQVMDKVATVLWRSASVSTDNVTVGNSLGYQTAYFSVLDGTLRKLQRFDQSPVAPNSGSYFYLAGAGTGTGRTFYEFDNTAAGPWGRVEQFIDRSDINDVNARDAAFNTARTANVAFGCAVEVIESPQNSQYVYGGAYGLGSPCVVRFGNDPSQFVQDVIRGCRFTFSPDGTVVVAPKIGRDNPIDIDAFGTIDLYGTQIREVQRT